jgi:hypothetical protein
VCESFGYPHNIRLPGIHDYIVYVSLNGTPDVVSEDVLL